MALPFTKENAAEMQRRSRDAMRKLNGQAPPDQRLIRARLNEIERAMRGCSEARALDAYSRAFERLFRVWCYIVGLPGPGSRRPAPEPKLRRKGADELDPTAASPVDLLRETE